jgi:hypothetical protein
MELFRGTRLFIGNLVLKQRRRKTRRQKKFNNLRNAHKIGIVWDGSRTEDFEALTAFYQEMQERNIQVDIICYYPRKVLPDKYTAIRYLTCIKRTDLNYFFIPQSDDIDEFINTPYEILIDINENNLFPVRFISVLSRAEFKVGIESSSYRNELDMTINIDKQYDASYYLEQVRYYLEMINTST